MIASGSQCWNPLLLLLPVVAPCSQNGGLGLPLMLLLGWGLVPPSPVFFLLVINYNINMIYVQFVTHRLKTNVLNPLVSSCMSPSTLHNIDPPTHTHFVKPLPHEPASTVWILLSVRPSHYSKSHFQTPGFAHAVFPITKLPLLILSSPGSSFLFTFTSLWRLTLPPFISNSVLLHVRGWHCIFSYVFICCPRIIQRLFLVHVV